MNKREIWIVAILEVIAVGIALSSVGCWVAFFKFPQVSSYILSTLDRTNHPHILFFMWMALPCFLLCIGILLSGYANNIADNYSLAQARKDR